MGLQDTRVLTKNGKVLTVLTQDIQRLLSKYEKFKQEMLQEDEESEEIN